MAFSLDAEQERQFNDIVSRYPNKQAACIPILHLCQSANGRRITDEIIQYVAGRLELSAAHVQGVVTFYSQFNTTRTGRHEIWVCRTLSCALRGGDEILATCQRKLGIHVGETTSDGMVTLKTAECLASCGTAPMMQVDEKYYENLSTTDAERIIDELRNQNGE
ncbi:MAG TPA: NAD(P)H-dependent oxidoreductase subunit E [Polyangiaceae bacterium]